MRKLAVLLACLVVLSGCQAKALSVKAAWARPGNAGGTGAVYFVIDNPTGEDDALLGASSAAAGQVELHMSMMGENDTMSMAPQASVPVPAGEKVAFEPGSLHVMLIGLVNDLQPGDKIQLTLRFQTAGELSLVAEVREP